MRGTTPCELQYVKAACLESNDYCLKNLVDDEGCYVVMSDMLKETLVLQYSAIMCCDAVLANCGDFIELKSTVSEVKRTINYHNSMFDSTSCRLNMEF